MALTDRFELGRRLGQGTFGTTHLGRERSTDRAVAIKCLPLAGLSEWKPVELFEREARVLRSLDHPGVPAFVDAFEDDDPATGHRFYIVSEYIEGPTLAAEIAGGRRWSPEQARALLRALLETLEYLHSLSPRVIHRDIKPGNVVLRADGQPVLVDFGSVRDVAAQKAGGGMTIAGTAGYMAPEQAMGISDARSDLYGLAATMTHVLTHVHPSELPRQGLRPRLRELAGVDTTLGRILERLLDPEPERRFASAAEVLRVLANAGGEAITTSLARVADEPGTALARGRVDPGAALARLSEGPRAVSPAIEERLGYGLALHGGTGLLMAVMVPLLVMALSLGSLGLPYLTLPMIFMAVGAGFMTPLLGRRKLRQLYASGAVTRGKIVSARTVSGSLYVSYMFRHDDREYAGVLLINDAFVMNRVGPDTEVLVFFDPKRPRDNVGLLPDEVPEDLRGNAGDE